MIATWRALILGVALNLASGPASATDVVRLSWPSAINSAIGPLTFAKQLGFLKEEDLDVEPIVLAGAGVSIPQLMAGTVDIAYLSLEPLPISRAPGKPNFPLLFVYNLMPRPIWEIAVLADSPIRTVRDLGGKTLGVVSVSSGNLYSTQAILTESGVDWKSVKRIAVGSGVPAFNALKTGQVDALNLWDTMNETLELQGTRIRRLELPNRYLNYSSHGLATTTEFLSRRRNVVARFGRALAKGTVACDANLVGCIQSFWHEYPSMKPANSGDPAVLTREAEILKPRLRNMLHGRTDRNMGAFTDEDWTQLIQDLKRGGVIPEDARIPINTLYTNALVPEFNAFSREQVVKSAHSYQY